MAGAGTPTGTERYRHRRCSPPWRRAKERPAVETASVARSLKSPAKRFCPPKRCHYRVQPTGYGDSVVTRFSPCRERVPPKRPAEPLPTRTMTEPSMVAWRTARLWQLPRGPRAIPKPDRCAPPWTPVAGSGGTIRRIARTRAQFATTTWNTVTTCASAGAVTPSPEPLAIGPRAGTRTEWTKHLREPDRSPNAGVEGREETRTRNAFHLRTAARPAARRRSACNRRVVRWCLGLHAPATPAG